MAGEIFSMLLLFLENSQLYRNHSSGITFRVYVLFFFKLLPLSNNISQSNFCILPHIGSIKNLKQKLGIINTNSRKVHWIGNVGDVYYSLIRDFLTHGQSLIGLLLTRIDSIQLKTRIKQFTVYFICIILIPISNFQNAKQC